jgi:hypothetical protein
LSAALGLALRRTTAVAVAVQAVRVDAYQPEPDRLAQVAAVEVVRCAGLGSIACRGMQVR